MGRQNSMFHEFEPNLLNVHFPTHDHWPVVWNNLPVDIRAEPDTKHFKNILKTYLFRLALDLLG